MRVKEDAYFEQTLQAATLIPSAGCVSNSHVAADAGVDASKLDHRYMRYLNQSGTVAAVTIPIHVARGAGVVKKVEAGSIAICTTGSVTIDVKKNGATILTAVITLDDGNTVRIMEAGTVSGDGSYSADDFFEVVVAIVSSGDLTGLCVQVEFDEAAA